ncbi:MAG: efflux RND transporter periplasmic adaptor subunit [Candidatus Omnitrophota bacterium]|nr:efflux RND transporter periplasmic adaptor subunit [Candidatus Omnitrophota bacterium]
MKNLKLVLVILISFALGIVISKSVFNKGKAGDHKERSLEEEGQHEEELGFSLNKKSQELIDLKTKTAQLDVFRKNISVVGKIAQDAQTSLHVVSPVIGTIVEVKAQIGSVVQKDDLLCVVSKVNGEASPHEVKAPIAGTVIGAFGKVGDRVDSVSSVYTIADLTKLWATLEVYEKDIAEIKLGQKAAVRTVAYPDQVFAGEIVFISPRVDENTHTIKVRIEVQNTNNDLKLGMFVNADIVIESDAKYILLPQEAVHIVGGKKIVFIKTADEKFEVREVKIKDEADSMVAVYEGIKEGEAVVIQDGFLLKSELLKSKMGEGCAE